MALSDAPCILLLIAGFLGLLLFAAAVYLVSSERHSSLISRKVYPLLMISLVANFSNMLTYIVMGVLFFNGYNDTAQAVVWMCFYVGILTEYWFFTPYLCRVHHVKAAYYDKSKKGLLGRQLYFHQSLTYLLWGFLPVLLAIIVLICCSFIGSFPYSFQETDRNSPLYRHSLWLLVYFFECLLWIWGVFQLRRIVTKFSISAELKTACAVFCAAELVQHPEFYPWVFFNVTTRNVILMCVSGIWPVLRQKKREKETIVTHEVLQCFELLLLHKEALKVFVQFIHSGDSERQDEENLLWLVLAVNELEVAPSKDIAMAIFRDYVAKSDFFSAELVSQIRDNLQIERSDRNFVQVFQDCRLVALRRLKMHHFPLFLKSMLYENYRRKVEKMNQIRGYSETSMQEMQ